jgi:hypothetical protein
MPKQPKSENGIFYNLSKFYFEGNKRCIPCRLEGDEIYISFLELALGGIYEAHPYAPLFSQFQKLIEPQQKRQRWVMMNADIAKDLGMIKDPKDFRQRVLGILCQQTFGFLDQLTDETSLKILRCAVDLFYRWHVSCWNAPLTGPLIEFLEPTRGAAITKKHEGELDAALAWFEKFAEKQKEPLNRTSLRTALNKGCAADYTEKHPVWDAFKEATKTPENKAKFRISWGTNLHNPVLKFNIAAENNEEEPAENSLIAEGDKILQNLTPSSLEELFDAYFDVSRSKKHEKKKPEFKRLLKEAATTEGMSEPTLEEIDGLIESKGLSFPLRLKQNKSAEIQYRDYIRKSMADWKKHYESNPTPTPADPPTPSTVKTESPLPSPEEDVKSPPKTLPFPIFRWQYKTLPALFRKLLPSSDAELRALAREEPIPPDWSPENISEKLSPAQLNGIAFWFDQYFYEKRAYSRAQVRTAFSKVFRDYLEGLSKPPVFMDSSVAPFVAKLAYLNDKSILHLCLGGKVAKFSVCNPCKVQWERDTKEHKLLAGYGHWESCKGCNPEQRRFRRDSDTFIHPVCSARLREVAKRIGNMDPRFRANATCPVCTSPQDAGVIPPENFLPDPSKFPLSYNPEFAIVTTKIEPPNIELPEVIEQQQVQPIDFKDLAQGKVLFCIP